MNRRRFVIILGCVTRARKLRLYERNEKLIWVNVLETETDKYENG